MGELVLDGRTIDVSLSSVKLTSGPTHASHSMCELAQCLCSRQAEPVTNTGG